MNVWRPSVVYQVLMLALGALLTLPSAGQVTWRRSYGGFGSDNALSVRQTTDGGYIVAGATGSFGNGSSDIYVVRIDEMGEHLWSRYYGGVGVDVGIACRELEDGYIIAGTTATGSIGGYDMILIRTDEEGIPVWQRNYGSADWDLCNAFALVEDGFILAGVTYGVGTPLGSGFAIKTDLNGEVQWNYTLPADQHSEFHGVIGTSDNGAALCGSVLATNGNPDGILAKVDLLGAEQWLTVVGGDSTDQFSSVEN